MLSFLELLVLSEQRLGIRQALTLGSSQGEGGIGGDLGLDTVCLPATVTELGNFLLEALSDRLASFFP